MNMPLLILAFGAGMLSFLSPCVLPLVPIYLGYLSGAAVTPEGVTVPRGQVMSHALVFVAGFTTIFVAIWSALFALTQFIDKFWLAHVSGVILIIFGVNMLGIIKLPFLYRDTRVQLRMNELGYPRSFLTGMAFAAGWTPCVGPMLSLILTAATQTQTALEGTALLLVYSAGLGVPFLLTAFALDTMVMRLRNFNKYLRPIEMVSGAILILVGIMLVTDRFQVLNAYFYQLTPAFIFEFEETFARIMGISLNQ
ncbi:MAG: cytochrome c biogenesis protein CcdA [Anaerolineae bacterium]|nr:cytochrome c biogenesis protein CcdA [Anaerolineae bacterium]